MSATEAFVHEVGHIMGGLFPGHADMINLKATGYGTKLGVPQESQGEGNEGYATNFESQWRVDVLGLGPRPSYKMWDDYIYLGHTNLFPSEP